MTKLSTLLASTALSRTAPASLAGGATLPVTARKILAVNEQIAGSTFNIPYTAESDYVQENAATGTDAAGGAFTLANSAGAAIDANTKLLIHADGANGSTEIVDERGITLFGTGCGYFDGSSYFTVPSSYKMAFGTQDYTLEFFAHLAGPTPNGEHHFVDCRGSGQTSVWFSYLQSTGKYRLCVGSSSGLAIDTQSAGTFAADYGVWHHFAIVRQAGTTKVYRDGISIVSVTDTNSYTNAKIVIGSRQDTGAGYMHSGWMDQFRVSKIARYTGPFAPPTGAFTTDADTVYLFQFDDGHGSQFIRDASRSGHDVRIGGNAQISNTRAKFGATSLKCNISTVLGGAAIDPTKPHNDLMFGSDNFTVDFWFYAGYAPDSNQDWLWCFANSSMIGFDIVYKSSLTLDYHYAYDGLTQSTVVGTQLVVLNQWNHVALTRAGANLYCFLNGQSDGVANVGSASLTNFTPSLFTVGYHRDYGVHSFNDHIDEFRVKRGQAVWTSNFTPPTGPYTTDDYTVLLLHFEGANGDKVTLDSSESSYGNNGFGDTTTPTLTFAGSAALSTSQTRGGNSTSLAPNGSSQYASIQFATPSAGHPLYFAAWEQFCIEGWFYQSNFTGTQRCWSLSNASLTSANQLNAYVTTGGVPTFGTGAVDIATGPTLSAGWNHVAVVRDGRGWTVYSNGVAGTTVQPQTNPAYANETYTLYLGSWVGSGNYLNGAIDSFRITHGKPRYTANFTPGNLTQDDDTALLWVFNGASGQKWVKELSKNTALIPATGARTVRDGRWIVPSSGGSGVLTTSTYKFGTASIVTGGTNGAILPHNSDLTPNGDFTIECQLRITNSYSAPAWVMQKHNGTNATWGFLVDNSVITNPTSIQFQYIDTTGATIQIWAQISAWWQYDHFAVIRSAGQLKMYRNGTLISTVAATNGMRQDTAGALIIGGTISGNGFSTWLDEIRLSNTARWTTNFTPPTLPYGQQYATGPFWVATKPGSSSLDLSAFSSIDNAAFTGAEPATTTLRFLISTDAYATALKVWNGSAWVSSGHAMSWNAGAGILTTAATAAQLNAAGNTWAQLAAGLVALDVSDIGSLNIVAVLATANRNYTPVLDAITLTMDEYVEMSPGTDYTVRFKDAAPVAQPMTVTRTKPGTGTVSVTYLP